MTSFPSASRMIGFVPRFALHTLRRMVVLPAFALPMTRMRNWGHWRWISSGPKAPSLNGRASLDDWLTADMGGEEKCTVSLEARWWSEINERGPYRKNRAISFSRQIKAVTEWRSFFSPSQGLCQCTPTKSRTIYRLLSVWRRKVVWHSEVVHHSERPARHEFMMAAKLGWTLDDSWRNLGCPLVSFSFCSFFGRSCSFLRSFPLETMTVLIFYLSP